MRTRALGSKGGRWLAGALVGALLAGAAPARAQGDEALGFELTPPRLSFADGEVSFWRPGAEDWTPAVVNIALAAGDELYTGVAANLEIQVGTRAYVRAGEETQLGITNLEPDYLQLRVASGHVSLDLRSLDAGRTFEIDTPNAAFTVERTGYYRVVVDGETTTLISRRGGQATVTPAAGASLAVAASEQVVVTGTDAPRVETYAAPEFDAWDRWNYARTDAQIDALSTRYVPTGVYGVDDLDQHGDWRVVPTYGPVWVPRAVAPGWAPYSTGRWMYDPFYDWTWVDDAPWGWAPYHYGRWVHVSGFWGWCPGPIVVRPYYAPALVAFYGGGGFSIGISIGTPYLGWVALGWGEPLIPWWGPRHFRRHPHWGGWGGPRIVNNVVINKKTVINIDEINIYQNAKVHNAVVAVDRDHFGRRHVAEARHARADEKLELVRGDLPVRPGRESLVAERGPAKRPPRETLERPVVAIREPRKAAAPELESKRAAPREEREERKRDAVPEGRPPARVVQPPREGREKVSERAPFGSQGQAERRTPPPAPRFRDVEQEEERRARRPARERATPPEAQPQPQVTTRPAAREERRGEARGPGAAPPAPAAPPVELRGEERREQARPERQAPTQREADVSERARELPGEPANQVYRQRSERAPREAESAPRSVERAPRDVERAPAARETRKPRAGHPAETQADEVPDTRRGR